MFTFTKIKRSAALMVLLVFTAVLLIILPGGKKAADGSEKGIDLPVIMYHSLLKDRKLQNDYTISPGLFEKDLKYITQNGYTTVTIKDLVNYVYSNKPLPEKCIMLTFDDGYYNNYYYAYPLLKEYNCRAVISPIISVTEKYTQSKDISVAYGYVSIDDIKEMVSSGLVEIQNHSYNMHSLEPRKGVKQKNSEDYEVYKASITKDITKAQDYLSKYAGVKTECFVYPFGAKSKGTLEIIRKLGFISTLTCTEKRNVITKNPESLFEMGRYRRRSDESMADLLERIKKPSSNEDGK